MSNIIRSLSRADIHCIGIDQSDVLLGIVSVLSSTFVYMHTVHACMFIVYRPLRLAEYLATYTDIHRYPIIVCPPS